MGRLEGKVVFLTGAGAGIAKATAKMCVREGAGVAICELNREAGERAEREIREETGLTVRVGEPLITVKHAYSHFRITLTAFRCAWVKGTPQPNASTALKWISPTELPAYPFPRANRKIAELLAK